jgi:hypothetical protein
MLDRSVKYTTNFSEVDTVISLPIVVSFARSVNFLILTLLSLSKHRITRSIGKTQNDNIKIKF